MHDMSRYHYRKFVGYLLFAGMVVGIDQFSKQMAYLNLFGQPPIEILPFFQLALVLNRGAAFGFLATAGGWQHYFFVALAGVISMLVIGWLWFAQQRNALLSWGLALVLGGALGNLLDRVSHQYVIDFILLHYHNWQFPAFNIADIAICCGAALLLFDELGRGRR